MRIKKLLCAALAGCVTASAVLGTAAFPVTAADAQTPLVFDLQCAGSNGITLTSGALAEGDISIPVSVYIPSNPGVNAIQLKFQINDGEEDENGLLQNYGFSLSDGSFAEPYCFDSGHQGSVSSAFSSLFTVDQMNLSWFYSSDPSVNADSASEAGTTAWNSDVSWAYANAFAEMTLVIPQGTEPGTYTFDVRTEPFLNALAQSQGIELYSVSQCMSGDSEDPLDFATVPLTIVVEEETTTELTTTTTTSSETTTTTSTSSTTSTTTTSATTTTTTTITTTSETTTSSFTPEGEPWVDDYVIENGGMYYIIGDVCGKPGEEVEVPVYVYGDLGTAAYRIYIAYDERLTDRLDIDLAERNWAYTSSLTINLDPNPFCVVCLPKSGFNAQAADGSSLFAMYVTIPEDAQPGTTYQFSFSSYFDPESGRTRYNEVLRNVSDDSDEIIENDVSFYGGSLTVVTDKTTPTMNYTSYSLTGAGEHVNLTLFNAYGDVTWSSSDPSVATVDQNGFVTATGIGTATITAANNGKAYTCALHVGVYGDVDGNGVIQPIDAMLALRAAAAITSQMKPDLTDEQLAVADVDGDGVVSVRDAQFILRYYSNTASQIDTNWRDLTGYAGAPSSSNLT